MHTTQHVKVQCFFKENDKVLCRRTKGITERRLEIISKHIRIHKHAHTLLPPKLTLL